MYDVMAIGNALVDHEYVLSDAALEETELTKGNMTLAGIEEQQQLLAYFKLAEIEPSKQAGGGSAANTMFTFASLGGKPFYACRVGDDLRQIYSCRRRDRLMCGCRYRRWRAYHADLSWYFK
jgi:sugar/nucleoside kinase (ribokinase family)